MRASGKFSRSEDEFMQRAMLLARKGAGGTSPNPMVGAVIVRGGAIIGEGFHKRAGEAHAEVNAIASARRSGSDLRGATLFVTLEPCSTIGRTPPCTSAIIENGISEVIIGATDPNAKHSGNAFAVLRRAGIRVREGLLAEECTKLNEAFNHWIVHRRPFVVCKCAMSLDAKIATNSGESKWITGEKARGFGMRLRLEADAIVAGVNTILRDDPSLTLRAAPRVKIPSWKKLRRVILDPTGRIPESARVLTDDNAALTSVVVTERAGLKKISSLGRLARVIVAPRRGDEINLRWLIRLLGSEEVTSLLVEGGGETHYSFLRQSLVGRVYFFYAPQIITGRSAAKAVGGTKTLAHGRGLALKEVEWSNLGEDLLCSALMAGQR